MKEISLLIVVCVLSFAIFVLTVIFVFIKKRKNLKWVAVGSLLICVCLSLWTGNQVIKKTSSKISEAFKPRTGEEIYKALFDSPQSDCVKVLHYQDQIVPKIDGAIWLYFETCPSEFKRILAKHDFTNSKEPTSIWNEKSAFGEDLKWINPKLLGDTVRFYEYSAQNGKNVQRFWASLDSTKVLCRDIAD